MKKIPIFLMTGSLQLVVACIGAEPTAPSTTPTPGATAGENAIGGTTPGNTTTTTKSGATTTNDRKITQSVLDSSEMRLNGFGVGLADTLSTKLPTIQFQKPAIADYVQIMRCRDDVRLSGLENIDIGNANAATADTLMKITDFWSKAAASQFCALVTESFSGQTFVDLFAPSNSYVYLGRGCRDRARIDASTVASVNECSVQVAVSIELKNFVNHKFEGQADREKQVKETRDRADTLGRQIYFLTVELNNEVERCEEREAANRAYAIQKAAWAQIIGIGIGLGATLMNPAMGIDAGSVTGALGKLFTSPTDFPRSCALSQKYRTDGDTAVKELTALKASYADLFPEGQAVGNSLWSGTTENAVKGGNY